MTSVCYAEAMAAGRELEQMYGDESDKKLLPPTRQ